MNMKKRHDEKILVDETLPDLQQTYFAEGMGEETLHDHQVNTSRVLDRSRHDASGQKTPDGNRSRVYGGGDISIDQEYLGKMDDIELANKHLKTAVDKLENEKAAEV